MKVRNPFLINIGRLLAMAVAVAIGSALAIAQDALPDTAPVSKGQSKGNPDDPTRTRNQPSSERNPAQPNRSDVQNRTEERGKVEATKKSTEQPARQPTVRPEDPTRGTTVRSGANARVEVDAANAQGVARRNPGLGIQFGEQGQNALAITKIEADSNAARAGFQVGDRIVSVNGRNLANPRQFMAFVSGQSGRAIPVIIERGGQRYTIQLQPSQLSNNGPWLGVYLQDNEENQTGARIVSVYPSGPAARAGLRSGDVIQQVNGKEVASTPDLIAMIDELDPRSRVEFVVQRGDQQATIPMVLGTRESFVGFTQRSEGGGDNNDETDEYSDIPPHAMQLEHDRRMAEQHQRIETELRKLQEEIRQLRELVEQRK